MNTMILRNNILKCLSNYYIPTTKLHICQNAIKPFLKPTKIQPKIASYSEEAYNINTNVVKDVILYKYENPRFFKMLNIFAICQFGFWAYLSHFAYSTLKNVPVQKDTDLNQVWWRNINLGENKYRIGITMISFFMGYGILVGAWMFSLKSVRYLILRKGGNSVTLVTYGPFGKNRMMTVNLKYISCKEMRNVARTYVPLKVKNQFLHYILDMKGEFKNPKLFDYTAGLKRNWKD